MWPVFLVLFPLFAISFAIAHSLLVVEHADANWVLRSSCGAAKILDWRDWGEKTASVELCGLAVVLGLQFCVGQLRLLFVGLGLQQDLLMRSHQMVLHTEVKGVGLDVERRSHWMFQR